MIAHHNDSLDSCWRKYGGAAGGSGDTEDCLTLDIFTSNVVGNVIAGDDLSPVVVYIDGDELSETETKTIRPTAGKKQKNYQESKYILRFMRELTVF